MTEIRKLTPNDLESWKAIRLEMLRLYPESFGESFEEAQAKPDEQYIAWLKDGAVFGSFEDGEPVGAVSFSVSKFKKMGHRGHINSVYVKQAYRGRGVANKLMKTVTEYAAACGVEQVYCTVVTTNTAAIKLYERHGFVTYGTEPRSLKTNGKYFDEHLMVKKIK